MAQNTPAGKEAYAELQREADRISSLIVASDIPPIDVVIQIRNLREFAERHFPHRMELFELIYESRFNRLWTQFRKDSEGMLPEW